MPRGSLLDFKNAVEDQLDELQVVDSSEYIEASDVDYAQFVDYEKFWKQLVNKFDFMKATAEGIRINEALADEFGPVDIFDVTFYYDDEEDRVYIDVHGLIFEVNRDSDTYTLEEYMGE